MRRILTTLVTLSVLLLVLKFLPPVAKHSGVQAAPSKPAILPVASDLHLSGVQVTPAPDGSAVYLDGLATNAGNGRISGATADIGFHDAQGRLVGTVHKPLVGMSHGGTDLVGNEFARNPITPQQMRFFRIAVPMEDVPSAWNHEVPELTIIDVKAH